MASKSQGPLHSNPKIAKALAENARSGHKYESAAELCRAVGITDLPTQRAVRGIMRDSGQGVGRGRRYSGITPAKVTSNARKLAAPVKAPKAKKAQSKPPVAAPDQAPQETQEQEPVTA